MSSLESGNHWFRIANLAIKTRRQYKQFMKFVDECDEINILVVTVEGDYTVLPYFFKGRKSINAIIMYYASVEIEFEF